jgi:hypothetical protein
MQFYADRVSLGSHRARTPEGHLVALAVPFARTGRQTYKAEEIDKDNTLGLTGLVEVYRPKEEVLSKSAISSFEGKSVTSLHPPQFLSPDNDGMYSRGHIQNVRAGNEPLPDGEWPVVGDIIIKDSTLIQQIEDGHRTELSAGYNYDLDLREDEHSPYPVFIQRNICGNHVAIVPSARGGSNLKVLDAKPEEEVEEMAEEVATAKPGMLAELATFCKTLGLRLVASDEDPGAVERNDRKDKEALTKKLRVDDGKSEELEKEDKGAKEPEKKEEKGSDKKAKDADESMDKKSATDARLDRVCDLLEKVIARDAHATDKCTCDAEEGEGHKKDCAMYKKESEDADLIPIHKLHGEEIPQNPIPGADAALEHLRKIRPIIAKSGDKQAIDSYNKAVRQLKEASDADGEDADYGDFTKLKKPEKVETEEARVARDSKPANLRGEEAGAEFAAAASKYHRMNASEVKKQ